MQRQRVFAAGACLLFLGACGSGDREGADQEQPKPEPVRPSATQLPPGTTPVAERVAVLGLLNKRNGISRDLTLKPGQAVRVDNVIVRLQTCEKTAPWEPQELTGAFAQVDVRNAQGEFQRVFSGWLFRESPSLNVVEHPVYDVWVKSCEMTHPASADASGSPEESDSSNSSAPKAEPAPAAAKASPPAGNSTARSSNSAESNSR